MAKNRGKFLTILLVFHAAMAVLSGFGLLFRIMGLLPDIGTNIYISILTFVLFTGGLYGIWIWKKWGVYSLIAYQLIWIISTIVLLKTPGNYIQEYAPGGIAIDIITVVLWFWAIRRKWSYFE